MSRFSTSADLYQPLLCRIKTWPVSGKSVVVYPFESNQEAAYALPFKDQTTLLQTELPGGHLSEALDPASMSFDMRDHFSQAIWVIAWVLPWLLARLEKEGRPLILMTPVKGEL